MIRKRLSITVFALSAAICALSQGKPVKHDLYNLHNSGQLQVINRTITPVTDNDKKGVRFSENEGDGIAWLNGVSFTNGIIELDIKGKDVLQKSFIGIAFHGIDEKTFDAVYFRPFNFHATDSVRRIHAVQYISHPDFPWEKLREQQNARYEKAIPSAPDPNAWFHAKILIDYPHVQVYVNDSKEPSLSIDKLNDRKNGKIGLWVGNGSGGDFANLTITGK